MNEQNSSNDDINLEENKHTQYDRSIKNNPLTPLAAISIITLIGLVCVIIDFYLESE